MERYPELKEHCAEVLAMLCDNARSNVYEDVAYQKNVRTSIRVLEQNDPAWRNKQTVEHTGTLNLTAGLMSKDDIAKMSNDDIQKLITVRKAVRQWTFECL